MSVQRQKGTRQERLVADYLAERLGDDRIDRRPMTGSKDRGDIAGVRTILGERVVKARSARSAIRFDYAVRRSGSDAQASLRRFIDAGLNPDSPRVHVAIGDPLVERDIELEQRGIDALT